jgi:hypothetical protein
MGPADNWVPGITPIALIVAHDGDAAVTISRIAVFPGGFEFDVTAVLRSEPADHGLMASISHGPAAMQVGVRYASGARGAFTPGRPGERHGGDVRLFPHGGHGSGTVFRQTFWASPLPPPGPVDFVVAWPARGLEEAFTTIEGQQIIDAGERAVQLWPDEPDSLPTADFTGVPLPQGGTPPEDAEAAETAIRAAFVQLFDNGPERHDEPLAAVQDGAAFAGVLEQIRERFPVEAATTRVALGQVVFLDGVRAAVQFELLRKGSFSLGPQVGYAVRERDGWKVARDTYTRVIGMAGIPIPPPPPPPSLQDMTRPAED